MEHPTHYVILGVNPGADPAAIRRSFRQKAKLFHPDVPGGNALSFIRMSEAYGILSDPVRRKAYDQARRWSSTPWRWLWPEAPQAGPADRGVHARPDHSRWTGATTASGAGKESSRQEYRHAPVRITRIMSLAVPRSGNFTIRGVTGGIRITTTTCENLWETTLRKFNAADSARLARHVIQIRVRGLGHQVRRLKMNPTERGAELQCMAMGWRADWMARGGTGFAGPASSRAKPQLSLEITVPEAMTIELQDVSGVIELGNMKGKLVAKVLGGIIRTGQVGDLHLHLQGNSRAFIANARGNVDLVASDNSKTFLEGAVHRLRAVLEHQASAEFATTVDILKTQVFDQASLNVKELVGEAHCDAQGSGRIRLTRGTMRGQ